MDEQEQPKKSKQPRKGQFDSDTPNNHNDGGVKSRKTILKAALRNGDFENSDWLQAFNELINDHGLKDTEALTLLRIATDPANRFLKFGHLVKGLEQIETLTARVKAARTPIVPVLAKLDGPQQAQLLADRAAILEGKSPVTPAVTPKPARIATEKPGKPVPVDDRAEWLKQMTGVGRSWEWPTIPEPVVETIQAPNKYEKIVLPPIVDGYNPPLQGEGISLAPTPAGSIRARFEKHKTISFEKTDHVNNSVVGNVIINSPGIPTKIFTKIRQSYFKLWQDHNYEPKYAPDNMREEYRMFLQSLDSIVLPTGQNTTPTVEAAGNFTKLDVKIGYPRGVKARRWGTAIDDAKKRGPRHCYGESLGTDLAQMYVDMDKVKGFDL